MSSTSYITVSSADFAAEYTLRTLIGEGTFSEVWSCVRRNSGRKVAAKILKLNYGPRMEDDAWNDIAEVYVSNSVKKHPCLLLIEEAYHDRDTGRVILITELMNKSLYDVIEDGECPLPEYRVKIYMYQMLEGLRYLHENGFIHRDIKPENILLKSGDKLLKIGDFGTTCRGTEGQPYAEYYVATRWYRSPECLLTRGWYSSKLDIWSTGCVLFEIATGRPLFDGRDEDDQVDRIDRVLGSPDHRLIKTFRKRKSETFARRYDNGGPATGKMNRLGVGLHTVYQPHWPAYEILKEMIVYDPESRFSADRLLRKPYFNEMRNTQFDQKIREFRTSLRR